MSVPLAAVAQAYVEVRSGRRPVRQIVDQLAFETPARVAFNIAARARPAPRLRIHQIITQAHGRHVYQSVVTENEGRFRALSIVYRADRNGRLCLHNMTELREQGGRDVR